MAYPISVHPAASAAPRAVPGLDVPRREAPSLHAAAAPAPREAPPAVARPAPSRRRPYDARLRFALLNLLAFSLLGVAWAEGLVERVLVADQTHICVVIFAVFLAGFAVCTAKLWAADRELDSVNRFSADATDEPPAALEPLLAADTEQRTNLAGALRMRISQRIVVVRHIAANLVLLGLIGTVVGFVIALSGVDPDQAGDVKAIAPMVSTLIDGMSTALYTTLVGAVLNIWLMADYHLLSSATVGLVAALVEKAEEHARHRSR